MMASSSSLMASNGLVHRGLSLATSANPKVTRSTVLVLPPPETTPVNEGFSGQSSPLFNGRTPPDAFLVQEWLQMTSEDQCQQMGGSNWTMASTSSMASSSNQSLLTCLLCERRRKSFYCRQCLSSGFFSHSDGRHPDHDFFVEKRVVLKRLHKKAECFHSELIKMEEKVKAEEELHEHIRVCRQRIKYFQKTKADHQVRRLVTCMISTRSIKMITYRILNRLN